MEWKTKVTELLGCKYPILQGAFAGLGRWEFAAAVANAGAHGIITAAVSRTPEQLREDIKKCREATANSQGSFGVNLTFVSMPIATMIEMLEVCIEEKIPVETAAYKPDALAPRIKESGLPWIHKTARIKDAVYAEKMGVDAVIVVGLEGVGFKSPEQLPTFITVTWGVKQIKVPLIAAGGIGDAHGFLGALGMGAEGIMMGTAFMATKECPMNDPAKLRIVNARPDNAELSYRVLSRADPAEYAEVMELKAKLPLREWLRMMERVNLRDPDWRKAADKTPQPRQPGSRVGSLAAGAIDNVLTCKELVDSVIQEAETILDSWQFLKTR